MNLQNTIFQQIINIPQEPRGYPCQNLNIIFPSEMPGIEWGYVICEQECVYPLFSGHNTICVVTALLVSFHLLHLFKYNRNVNIKSQIRKCIFCNLEPGNTF